MGANEGAGSTVAVAEPTTTIRGKVERLFFRSDEFCAGQLRANDGKLVTFNAKFRLEPGDLVGLVGTWGTHKKYGNQFAATDLSSDLDLSPEGLASFLANHPDMKGIGPAKAKLLAQKYAETWEASLENDAEGMALTAGVKVDVIVLARDVWQRTASTNATRAYLAAFGLTHHQITKIVGQLGNRAIDELKRDPFQLADIIDGFGFKKLDVIAQKLGTSKTAPSRIRAGLIDIIKTERVEGHCFTPWSEVVRQANILLYMDGLDAAQLIRTELEELVRVGALKMEEVAGTRLLGGTALYAAEKFLATRLSKSVAPHALGSMGEFMQGELFVTHPDLNDEQSLAAARALTWGFSVITGGAGTGKTFTERAIVEVAEAAKMKVLLAAPTGKAARRMTESTGREAKTIHRLLEFNPFGGGFARNAENPIEADLVIVDEASMLDVQLAYDLFRAIDPKKTALVLVGDPNQLPAVGAGNVLKDIIERRADLVTQLAVVVRQSGDLKSNCNEILEGKVAPSMIGAGRPWYIWHKKESADVLACIRQLYEKDLALLGFDPWKDVQLLVPTHKGPIGGAALNEELQTIRQRGLNGGLFEGAEKRPKFCALDRVIQTKNDYDTNVMNGTLGVVSGVEPLGVEFEDGTKIEKLNKEQRDNISLAYALTVHKSQGSEFPCIVVICHRSHFKMLHRNWLYTAVTRARRCVILVGDTWAVNQAAMKVEAKLRRTWLGVW